jgi:hypothetical protein
MTKFTQLMDLLNDSKNKFIAICTNANRDLPFSDHYKEVNQPQ